MTTPQPTPATDLPLDLSSFSDMGSPAGREDALPSVVTTPSPDTVPAEIRTALPNVRLVDPTTLDPDRLAKATALAATLDFSKTSTTVGFIENALEPVARISRQLLTDTKVGEMGEVGRVAAAVIDGIHILRIEELQQEAAGIAPKATGFLAKTLHIGKLAKGAIASFSENRKKFLTLMDQEEARARKVKADLMVTIELLDEQSQAVREGVSDLTIGIAAAQIALDKGFGQAETLRQTALASKDPTDAALALDYRNSLLNFQGRVSEIRAAMISSAALVPIISLNRKAAETRVSKLSNGILLTIPRLMAAASQAAVQADIRTAALEHEKLDEADRRVLGLIGSGAHDAAVSAARSLGADPRNIEALAVLARQTIDTLHEVVGIEEDMEHQQKAQEQKLVDIRNTLVLGMTEVQQRALARPVGNGA